MKITIRVGLILAAVGCVQVISSKEVSIKMVKDDPNLVLSYAVAAAPESAKFQEITKSKIKLEYKDTSTPQYLYIERPNDPYVKNLLLRRAKDTKSSDLIVINEVGVPRYETEKSFEKFKEMRSKYPARSAKKKSRL